MQQAERGHHAGLGLIGFRASTNRRVLLAAFAPDCEPAERQGRERSQRARLGDRCVTHRIQQDQLRRADGHAGEGVPVTRPILRCGRERAIRGPIPVVSAVGQIVELLQIRTTGTQAEERLVVQIARAVQREAPRPIGGISEKVRRRDRRRQRSAARVVRQRAARAEHLVDLMLEHPEKPRRVRLIIGKIESHRPIVRHGTSEPEPESERLRHRHIGTADDRIIRPGREVCQHSPVVCSRRARRQRRAIGHRLTHTSSAPRRSRH